MQQRHIFTKIIICLAHKTRFNQTMNAVHKKSLPREALNGKNAEIDHHILFTLNSFDSIPKPLTKDGKEDVLEETKGI
jgi:hypothetical protein